MGPPRGTWLRGTWLRRGHNAVVTARDAASVQALADTHPGSALALALDVTDPAQVAAVVREAEERFGAVDVLVNNAGYGYRSAVEEGGDADIEKLFATNGFLLLGTGFDS